QKTDGLSGRPSSFLKLSLGELRCSARLFEAVLLALLDAGVAGEEACLFEGGANFGLALQKRPCDAEADRTCLARIAAADDVHEDIVLAFCRHFNEGLLNDVLKRAHGEVVFERAIVDDD